MDEDEVVEHAQARRNGTAPTTPEPVMRTASRSASGWSPLPYYVDRSARVVDGPGTIDEVTGDIFAILGLGGVNDTLISKTVRRSAGCVSRTDGRPIHEGAAGCSSPGRLGS